jgi:nitroreductase
MASFRLFAGSELSLGTVLASAILGNHPAVQNMLLAPRALGLGATLTTLYLNFGHRQLDICRLTESAMG